MRILLEKEEAIGFIHSALCNGGLSMLNGCDITLNVGDEDYAQAKAEWIEKNPEFSPCIEDVWAQILRSGKSLDFYDHEGREGVSFTVEQAVERLAVSEAVEIIDTYKNEGDDADTAYELLQFCMYGKVIFC